MAAPVFDWQPSDADLELVPLHAAVLRVYAAIAGRPPEEDADRERRCNALAAQLALLAPLYTIELAGGPPRLLTRIELMLARFEGGGARLVHRDRLLSHGDLRIRRIDLAEAMERLRGRAD